MLILLNCVRVFIIMDDEIKKTPDDLVNDNSSDQENDSKHKESEDLSQPGV